MKHPLNKLSKKNRNIISGILVGLASIYAVASYFDLPQADINTIFISTLLLVLGIMLFAITAVLVIKGIHKLSSLISNLFRASDDK